MGINNFKLLFHLAYKGFHQAVFIALDTNPSYCVLTLFCRSLGATLILNDDK